MSGTGKQGLGRVLFIPSPSSEFGWEERKTNTRQTLKSCQRVLPGYGFGLRKRLS
jgi:hypothetical protein